MMAAALLERNVQSSDNEIRGAMSPILCRCQTCQLCFCELAIATNTEPLDVRLNLLSRPWVKTNLGLERTIPALREVAQQADWGSTQLEWNEGMGIASHMIMVATSRRSRT